MSELLLTDKRDKYIELGIEHNNGITISIEDYNEVLVFMLKDTDRQKLIDYLKELRYEPTS